MPAANTPHCGECGQAEERVIRGVGSLSNQSLDKTETPHCAWARTKIVAAGWPPSARVVQSQSSASSTADPEVSSSSIPTRLTGETVEDSKLLTAPTS
jgi:hypothetical protein